MLEAREDCDGDWLQYIKKHNRHTLSISLRNEQTGEVVQFRNQTPIEVVNYPVRSLEKKDLNIKLDYEFNFLAVEVFRSQVLRTPF